MLKVLIALDGSPSALCAAQHVADLARRGTPIEAVLLTVQPPIMAGEIGVIASAQVAQAERARAAAEVLGPVCLIMLKAGVPYVEEVLSDAPATAITACASRHAADVIMMGSRGLSSLKRLVLGSVSKDVLHLTDLPVTLFKSGKIRRLNDPARLLVAVDGSSSALRAAEYAAKLAREIPRCEVHLLHVRPSITYGGVLVSSRDEVIKQWSATDAEAAFAEPGEVFDRAGLPHTLHIEEGEPAACIVKAARTLAIDLVFIGTRGLGRVASVAIGSVADAVLRQAPIPVTMVR
ncbi:MAG: universal stress protein [Burkholderiales bacterium]